MQPEMLPLQADVKLPPRLGRASIAAVRGTEILNRGTGFLKGWDWTLNPYRGCSFACDYCYASNFAGSEAKQENWGQWVEVKTNAAERLSAIPRGALNGNTIYMSSATDPYQPVEQKTGITRQALELLAERQPRVKLVVQTRSPLVCRDAALLREIEEHGGRVQVNVTVTTDSEPVRRVFEPYCPSIPARLKAVAELAGAGVQTCVTVSPMLPLADPTAFAQALLETQALRFTFQAFRPPQQAGIRMKAMTDRKAEESAKAYYQSHDVSTAIKLYQQEYQRNTAALRQELGQKPGVVIGYGQEGFKPPF